MPDISQTLEVPITVLGQLNTIFSVVSIAVSLAMGLLTVKYETKSLLIAGITTLILGLTGAAISQNYTTMLIFYILYGTGLGLVMPITNLLITLFPLEKRTLAMGRVYSGRSLTSIIATPIIGFLATTFGWRIGYIGFGLPLIILTGLLVLLKIPQQPKKEEKVDLVKGFKDIYANTSAKACLLSSALVLVFFNSLMVFNGAYLRNTLGFSIESASLIMSLTFISVAVGQVSSGRIVAITGIKRATYIATFVCGGSLLAYFSLNMTATLSIVALIIGVAAAGITMTTLSSLALEQVPESRGTMMSLVSAGISFSSMLGSAIGGVGIDKFGFKGYGIIMFNISLVAILIIFLWVNDRKSL
jgi:DHA1 family inner membrane transport protein